MWFFFVGTAVSALSKDRSVLISLKRPKNGFVNFPGSSNGRDDKIVKQTTEIKTATDLRLYVIILIFNSTSHRHMKRNSVVQQCHNVYIFLL